MVGPTGLLPVEDECVQMLSSVTEGKLSEVGNDVNMSCKFLVLCGCTPTCAKHFNLLQVYSLS